MRRQRETPEYAAFVRRILRAYARRGQSGAVDPVDLADLRALRGELDAAIDTMAIALHTQGFSWTEIGAALGMTRQAAQKRWAGPRDRPPAATPFGVNPELTQAV